MSEEEFLILADNLRPWTERAMKIEVAPWIRDYVVEMQELYCELILEEVVCKPSGIQRTIVEDYEALFDVHTTVPNKILAKGDPGIGKTTWGKKIAWDWAKEKFSKVSIVLFVYLKFVHPRDSLENAMIEQIPELEGFRVSPSKLESFIEHFGERCLLILDGLDEHAIGSNKDVLKVMQHRKYLDCNIILTSRPHSIAEIQGYCDTVVSINGFTRSEAKKFALCIVLDETLVEEILDFNPTGDKQEVSLCKCPILLSFMCILVREQAVDLTNKSMPTGEIYTRMIQCLYKKLTIRRKILYDDVEFTKVVGLVGKLAWESLLLGDPLFERSRVEGEVGKDTFDYGFLIGHEDMIGDLKADILITFAHRSIQEFFGAFFIVSQMIKGKESDDWISNEQNKTENTNRLSGTGGRQFLLRNSQSRLTRDTEKDAKRLLGVEHIFTENPLFLHFCFWFLSGHCEYFTCGKKEVGCSVLHSTICERLTCRVLNLGHIATKYPALNILSSVHAGDKINLSHFGKILQNFDKLECLTVRYHDPIDWILDQIKNTLTLIVVEDESQKSKYNLFPELLQSNRNNLSIVLSDQAYKAGILKYLLQRAVQWKRQPIVYLFLTRNRVDLSEILHPYMYELHVISTVWTQTKVIAISDLVSCPFLTHLSITGHVALDESVMSVMDKAVRERKLSCIKSFACSNLPGRIRYLFGETIRSTLTNLSFYDIYDLGSLSQPWLNVASMCINTLTKSDFKTVMKSIAEGMLTNLKKLCLAMKGHETIGLEDMKPEKVPRLEHLGLQRCITSKDVLEQLSHLVTHWTLHTLDIRHSRGIKGKLSILLQYEFPAMKSLILHNCALNEEDLKSLGHANIQSRLPVLADLDLSQNCRLMESATVLSSNWHKLKRLKLDHQPSSSVLLSGLHILEQLIGNNCIHLIRELRLAM